MFLSQPPPQPSYSFRYLGEGEEEEAGNGGEVQEVDKAEDDPYHYKIIEHAPEKPVRHHEKQDFVARE